MSIPGYRSLIFYEEEVGFDISRLNKNPKRGGSK